jgi:hypothetical protein
LKNRVLVFWPESTQAQQSPHTTRLFVLAIRRPKKIHRNFEVFVYLLAFHFQYKIWIKKFQMYDETGLINSSLKYKKKERKNAEF